MTPQSKPQGPLLAHDDSVAPRECLTEDEILAFAGGHLASQFRQQAHLHLDACDICQRLLNEAVHALALAATHGSPEQGDVVWNTTFRAGTLVDRRYVIRRFVARGGMGEVFEAYDQELQERVALKTVNATACDDPGAVRRLKAEVQLARRVSHPSVCRIYDFGTHSDPETGGQLSFLTMEFVDGTTLGRHLRLGGPLPVDQARTWARALLRGLSAAHEAGVLHRDFKSDNVMLREEGNELQPLILDFGLARALDQRSQHSSAGERGLIGTFAYIAPEQLEGKAHSIASDIYAFGVVLFEMLTGQLPFGMASSAAATTLDRLTRRAPAPSSKNPQVPRQLDALVHRCLERSPADRFKTTAEVLAQLDALEAQGQTPPRRGARRAVAAGAAAALLAAGLLYWAVSDGGGDDATALARASSPPAGDAAATAVPPSPTPMESVEAPEPPPKPEPAATSRAMEAGPASATSSHGSHPTGPGQVRAGTEPARINPAQTERAQTEPAQTTDPVPTEPATVAREPAAKVRDGWENPFRPND